MCTMSCPQLVSGRGEPLSSGLYQLPGFTTSETAFALCVRQLRSPYRDARMQRYGWMREWRKDGGEAEEAKPRGAARVQK